MQLHALLIKHKLMLLALAVMCLVTAVYWQTFFRIVDMWSSYDYQYGWLVYPASLYVLYERREALARAGWETSVHGAILAVLSVMIWLVSRTVGLQVIEFLSATLLILASFWALAGNRAARAAAFPLLLTLVSVPMGGFLVEPLMHVTAEISSGLLALVGIPAYRDGQFFDLPGGSFEVADVCSGLRYLLAGAMAALAYAYVTYTSNAKRLLFIAIVSVVLVIANGVRAFIVMAVASATNMRILGGEDHLVFGTILFAVLFIAMVWVGEGYADKAHAVDDRPESQPVSDSGAVSRVFVALAVVTVIAGPVLGAAMTNRGSATIAESSLPSLEHCAGPEDWTSEQYPAFPTADFQNRGLFACGDYQVGVYVASYADQQQGKELIGWGNRVWPIEWRRYVDRSTVPIQAADGSVDVQQVLVRHPAGWRLIRYWYQVGPSVTGSQNRVKLLETWNALTMQPVESTVVVVSVISDSEDNEEILQRYLERHTIPVLHWNDARMEQGERQ